jgi:replicative DNA helicase
MNKLEQLKQENEQITNELVLAERMNDFDTLHDLKRKFYSNKLAILDLLNVKNEKFTMTARDLKTKVSNMPNAIRYETGVYGLDAELRGGFEVGSLIQLAGASGAGKTTLFLKIVANIAKYAPSCFFNFEMGDRRIIKRLATLLTEDIQWDNLLLNSETRNVNDLVMEITLLASEGMKFFAVDSRMKLRLDGSEAEYQKISKMSSMLSECAIKHDIIILMINQISEEDLKSGRLSFKGSGDQMFDSDMALFIVVNEDESRELICRKNRQDEHLFKFTLPHTKAFNVSEIEYVHEDVSMSIL